MSRLMAYESHRMRVRSALGALLVGLVFVGWAPVLPRARGQSDAADEKTLEELEAEYEALQVVGESSVDQAEAPGGADEAGDLEAEYADLEVVGGSDEEATGEQGDDERGGAAGEEVPPAPADPSADASELEESSFDILGAFFEDPTLGGRFHFTYMATYWGRFHDFGPYDYPFPDSVRPDDEVYARELERRHRDWQDHDLDQYLAASFDRLLESDGSDLWQRVDADLSMRYWADLDGSSSGEASLNGFDTFSSSNELQLLTASATVETFRRHLVTTLGRQYQEEAEWIHFDGAHSTFRGLTLFGRPVELSAFGGARVRLYRRTSSEHVGLAGGTIRYWPLESLLIRLSDVWHIDNSFEAEARQRFGGLGYAALTYRQINEDPHSLRFDTHIDWTEGGVSFWLQYFGKLGREADDFDFDYTRSRRREAGGTEYLYIGDIVPYDEISLEARKSFLDSYGLFVGATLHRLRDRDLKDEYNTDWHEVWGGFDLVHAPWRGFTGRATVRYLNTDLRRRLIRLPPDEVIDNGTPDFRPEDITGDGEPDFLGVEVLLEQDFARVLSAGVLTIFRGYDYQSNYAYIENLNATSVTAYLRWSVTERAEWYLAYSWDRDFELIYPDLDALHTVRVRFAYRF